MRIGVVEGRHGQRDALMGCTCHRTVQLGATDFEDRQSTLACQPQRLTRAIIRVNAHLNVQGRRRHVRTQCFHDRIAADQPFGR